MGLQPRPARSHLSEGIVAFDSAGKLYFVNGAALDLYGLTRRDLRGNVHDLDPLFQLHDLGGERVLAEAYPTARLLRGESFRDYRVWVYRKVEDRR